MYLLRFNQQRLTSRHQSSRSDRRLRLQLCSRNTIQNASFISYKMNPDLVLWSLKVNTLITNPASGEMTTNLRCFQIKGAVSVFLLQQCERAAHIILHLQQRSH